MCAITIPKNLFQYYCAEYFYFNKNRNILQIIINMIKNVALYFAMVYGNSRNI